MVACMSSDATSNKAPPALRSQTDSDVMILDAQTLKDLEIFTSEMEGASLFDFCNHTRNKQGAMALQERMKRPWSNPARIHAVQESLSFIIAHRHTFDRLPSFVTTEIVERYFHGTLPLVTNSNSFEFCMNVLELRYGDVRRYYIIKHGVEATSSLIRALRQIIQAPELASPRGELSNMLEEIRTLLGHNGFALIPDKETRELGAWRILKIDQLFRVYQKQAVDRLLKLIYQIDALLSLADTTQKNSFIMPSINAGPLSVQAEGLVHPLFPEMVSNPVKLDQEHRLLFLTGPNMAGKTTYLRAIAVALYFAHLGMGVPARSFHFVPAQRLFSSITLADNLHNGVSFFRAEALRIKDLAQALADGGRVIALLDEPFKGTNVKDAFDASSAILKRFASKQDSLFMFSSHLIELCEQMTAIDKVDCRYFEAGEQDGRLHFEYVLRHGVSSQRLGMRVLQEVGVFELLDHDGGG